MEKETKFCDRIFPTLKVLENFVWRLIIRPKQQLIGCAADCHFKKF
jgi:hypothetical protein